MFALLKRLFGKKSNNPADRINPEADFIVSIVDGEIINQRPEGVTEKVAVSDLKAVIIETNDSGPWGADVWWILLGSGNNGCVFPMGATGEKDILHAVQDLPGFDNEALIKAMMSTSNQKFLCWKIDP